MTAECRRTFRVVYVLTDEKRERKLVTGRLDRELGVIGRAR